VGFFIEAIFGTGFLPFGAGRKKHSLWDKADPSNFYAKALCRPHRSAQALQRSFPEVQVDRNRSIPVNRMYGM